MPLLAFPLVEDVAPDSPDDRSSTREPQQALLRRAPFPSTVESLRDALDDRDTRIGKYPQEGAGRDSEQDPVPRGIAGGRFADERVALSVVRVLDLLVCAESDCLALREAWPLLGM